VPSILKEVKENYMFKKGVGAIKRDEYGENGRPDEKWEV